MRKWMVGIAAMCALLVMPAATAGDTDPGGATVAARASQTIGFDFRISGVGADSQDQVPEVAHDSTSNRYLVVWTDWRHEGTKGSDIYGRLVAADGTRLGPDFRVNSGGGASGQGVPAVAHNPTSGRFLVVWRDERNFDTRGNDVFGRQVSANGTPIGVDFRISDASATANDQAPAVAYNPVRNQFFVVWEDWRNASTRGSDIYGRRIAANGNRIGSDLRLSGGSGINHVKSPAIAYNSVRNQYLVVWEDRRNYFDDRGSDIYGRRIAANGKRVGFDFRISGVGATATDQSVSVAHNAIRNQFLVVWEDYRNDDTRGSDIYGRRIAANGNRLGFDFRISGIAAKADDRSASVAHLAATNQFLVVWEDWRDIGDRGTEIYGRRIAANGNRVGSDFGIGGNNATGFEYLPALTSNPTASQFLVVWQDSRNGMARGSDIYGRRVAG